jgi:hypothetical protein
MEIGIRKAAVDDYHFLCELFDEVDGLHRDNLPHIFQKPDGAVREQDYFLELLADEDTALFVAEAGGGAGRVCSRGYQRCACFSCFCPAALCNG